MPPTMSRMLRATVIACAILGRRGDSDPPILSVLNQLSKGDPSAAPASAGCLAGAPTLSLPHERALKILA